MDLLVNLKTGKQMVNGGCFSLRDDVFRAGDKADYWRKKVS